MARTKGNARQNIKTLNKQKKKVSFVRMRMWINYALSLVQRDRGQIPENIGSRILITNNTYVTRYYLSAVIQIIGLSLDTPVDFIGSVIRYLRENNSSAVVDFTFKNVEMTVDLRDPSLKSRVAAWESIANSDKSTNKEKDIAARCLYTKDVAAVGEKLYRTRLFLTVRAKTGQELIRARQLVFRYLNSKGIEYDIVVGDMKEKLAYSSLISDKAPEDLRTVKSIVNSAQTLSQLLPNSSAFNGEKGVYFANDITNNNPYILDLSSIASARNIYLVGASGDGKTVLAVNIACSAFENGMAVCVQDIKGNEFNHFIEATGGYIVSLRQEAIGYINSWRMRKEDTTDENAETYFRQRVALAREQMLILAGITRIEERIVLEELLEAFHNSLYISLGVLASNRNTWKNTESLNPFRVYEMFLQYMTPEMQRKYNIIASGVMNNLRMTMSREGSKSYIFNTEFDYLSILKAPTLMFDFGMLEGATSLIDPMLFKLKFLYMRKLNADYIAYKYSKQIKVFKILEEAQIAVTDAEIMKGYVEEFTLRRAQGQTTLLLGNSISALTDSSMSKSLIENVKALLIGNIVEDAKKIVIEKFNLAEYKDVIDSIGISSETKHSFLFINRMQSKTLTPILKVHLAEDVEYKLFEAVPQNASAVI